MDLQGLTLAKVRENRWAEASERMVPVNVRVPLALKDYVRGGQGGDPPIAFVMRELCVKFVACYEEGRSSFHWPLWARTEYISENDFLVYTRGMPRVMVSFKCPKSVHVKLLEIAREQHCTLSRVVREVIRDYRGTEECTRRGDGPITWWA